MGFGNKNKIIIFIFDLIDDKQNMIKYYKFYFIFNIYYYRTCILKKNLDILKLQKFTLKSSMKQFFFFMNTFMSFQSNTFLSLLSLFFLPRNNNQMLSHEAFEKLISTEN